MISQEKGANRPKTVYVAMSGGVDSSVAVALLKERGFKVVGVFFKPWQPKRGVEFCNWKEDRQDAMAVAAVLGIPFKTWDFSKEYQKKVGNYMIDAYREGITPNPDVQCNKEIKFGLFLKRALAEGTDYIATGHYARKRPSLKFKVTSYKLLKGKDKNKDQSYFLWTLTQKELKYSLFPIGDYTKPEVRKMAKKLGLPNHAKKDSQGVCFIGQLNMHDFLKFYIRPKPGKIILLDSGQVIGKHDGVYFYTIGQRHGLNISRGGEPYYVAKKDLKNNVIYVSKAEASLHSSQCLVMEVSWVGVKPSFPLKVGVKVRYRAKTIPAILYKKRDYLELRSVQLMRAITPGQSAVFYQRDNVLGGGIVV